MTEKKRSMLRSLAGTSAAFGILLALCAAGTSDFHDELQFADEETRQYYENKIISEKSCVKLAGLSAVFMLGGAAGLILTEKKGRKR